MIELKDLSFGYQHSRSSLFDQLNFKVVPNTICGLLGKNGAGKTTLLKMLSGLMFPLMGQCQIDGVEIGQRIPGVLEKIFFIPEECELPALTVEQYLSLYVPFYKAFDISAFKHAMTVFGVNKQSLLTQFSLGEKKKFQISFALASNCPLILFDEPTNGLDIPSKTQFRQLIAESMREDRIFIISTHQVHDVEQLIDRMVVIDNGEILLNATIEAIAKKVKISHSQSKPSDSALYFEKTIQGYKTIEKNSSLEEEGYIDFELFFNMAISNRNLIKTLFQEQTNA